MNKKVILPTVDDKVLDVPPSASVQEVTQAQLVNISHGYLRAACHGFVITNPMVPSQALWRALNEAFGRVMSEATASDTPSATIAARGELQDSYAKALRTFVPAIKPVANSGLIS